MRVIFFSKCSKFDEDLKKAQNKSEKDFFFFLEITTSELVALNCLY